MGFTAVNPVLFLILSIIVVEDKFNDFLVRRREMKFR
jgi:hypothetical protein